MPPINLLLNKMRSLLLKKNKIDEESNWKQLTVRSLTKLKATYNILLK
jgi:hypothetical protein